MFLFLVVAANLVSINVLSKLDFPALGYPKKTMSNRFSDDGTGNDLAGTNLACRLRTFGKFLQCDLHGFKKMLRTRLSILNFACTNT